MNRTERIMRRRLPVQKKELSFEGEVERYWNKATTLHELKLAIGLDTLGRIGYQYNTIGEHAKAKDAIEILEP